MSEDKIDPQLENMDELLRKAASRPLTLEEIKEQRISLAMGMLSHDSTTTRKEMEREAKRFYG